MNEADQTSLLEDSSKPATMLARINSICVKALFPFVATEDVRLYLCGINLRPLDEGGVMITATNGHMIGCMRDPEGYAEKELIVSVNKDGMKHCQIKHTFDVMSNGAVMVSDEHANPLFLQPGNSLMYEGDGNPYPRIEKVATLNGYNEGLRATLNPQYLEAALKFGKHFGAIRFFSASQDAGKPVMFTLSAIGELEAFGAIMPMAEGVSTLPTWLPKPDFSTLD